LGEVGRMKKVETDPEDVLTRLGELSGMLINFDTKADFRDCFRLPVKIMRETMGFDVSVVYKITNSVDQKLLLEIIHAYDPDSLREDLVVGEMLQLDLERPDPIYRNETQAFITRQVSSINVPHKGCDIMGFIYLPQSLGGGYLLGGDFCGHESAICEYEVSVCQIMCNFIGTAIIKIEFEHLAIYDALTGLFNSNKIRMDLKELCSRQLRHPHSPSHIGLCDIDHFKTVNDTYGHIQGDVILKEIGNIFLSSVRESIDIVGRYGGEEFLILLEDTDENVARHVVERIRSKVEEHRFTKVDSVGLPISGEFIEISISVGLACSKVGTNCDSKEWLSRADTALYNAKQQGRNRTVIWQRSI